MPAVNRIRLGWGAWKILAVVTPSTRTVFLAWKLLPLGYMESGRPEMRKTRDVTRDAIREELERRRSALASAIQSTRDTAEARQEAAKDPYGGASATHDSEIAVAVAERLARQLAQLDRACVDFDAGRYGVCQDCEEPIPAARLKVLPFATRCVPCQASLENERAA